MKCCIHGGNFIRLLYLLTELFKFEIQKCGQILCAHKPYFLMPGIAITIYTLHLTEGSGEELQEGPYQTHWL